MYAPIVVLVRSANTVVRACWLPTCMTWTAKSSTTTPATSATRDQPRPPIANHEPRRRTSAMPVTSLAGPVSAHAAAPAAAPPGAGRGRSPGAREAGDAEQPDLRLAQVPRLAGQRESQAAPQGAEGGEEEERNESAAEEEPLGEQPEEGPEDPPVGLGAGPVVRRQRDETKHADNE